MPEEKTLGETIKEIRETARPPISQRKLAKLTGIDQSYVNRIEKNTIAGITTTTLDKISAALGVPTSRLLNQQQPKRTISEIARELAAGLERVDMIEIPYRGYIPAGMPCDEEEMIEYVTVPRTILNGARGDVYALIVKGESLAGDGLHTDDYAIVEKDAAIIDGKIYALRLDNKEVVARHVKRLDGKVRLYSTNDGYKDIELDQVEVLGRIIGKVNWTKL